jgi:hypothetical protein
MFGAVHDGLLGNRDAFLYVGISLLKRSLFAFSLFVLRPQLGFPVFC